MLNALWKYYGHCAAQLCKSWLLTKLKGQTVRQPALSLAACFPVSQVHLVNCGTEQRIAQHCCSESVFPTPPYLPILPKALGKWIPVDAYRRSCPDKCFPEGWQGECHFLRITGSLQILSDTVDGWGKFRNHVRAVGTLEVFVKGREQTQSILFFFISQIAGQ